MYTPCAGSGSPPAAARRLEGQGLICPKDEAPTAAVEEIGFQTILSVPPVSAHLLTAYNRCMRLRWSRVSDGKPLEPAPHLRGLRNSGLTRLDDSSSSLVTRPRLSNCMGPAGAILPELAAKRMQACTSRCMLSDQSCASTLDTSSVLTLLPFCVFKRERSAPFPSFSLFIPRAAQTIFSPSFRGGPCF
ncbi:hypothetical protein KCV06_g177, partial [Aureobasidium melanogenum]